jgi:hypothetical protein
VDEQLVSHERRDARAANASRPHLLDLARRLDIPGRSRMTKTELVHAIKAASR